MVNQRVGAKGDPAGLDARDANERARCVRRRASVAPHQRPESARPRTMVGIDQSQIARIEASHRGIDVQLFAQILEVGGMRLTIVDAHGVEITPVGQDVLRDNAGRRMPAHLDVLGPGELPYFALRGPRYDRAKPGARYHHRRARDQRRTESASARAMISPRGVTSPRSSGRRERLVSWRPDGERAHCSPTTAPAFPRAGSTRVARRAANAGAVGEPAEIRGRAGRRRSAAR